MHDGKHPSLLSQAYDGESQEKKADLHGVVNLLILLLFITSLKNIVISCRDNGFTLKQVVIDYIKAGTYTNPSVSYTVAGIMFLSVFIMISFWIEVLGTTRVNKAFVFILIASNLCALVVFPIVLVNQVQSDYMVANMMMLVTTTVFLKLVSFHHVMQDTRYLVVRLIRLKEKGEEVPVNEFE